MSAYPSTFFSLPVVRHNGVRLSHEDVVSQLYNDTVSYEATLGVLNSVENVLRVTIEVKHSAYETGIAWLRDLLYGSEFDKGRCVFISDLWCDN
jgi:hypothetical protein